MRYYLPYISCTLDGGAYWFRQEFGKNHFVGSIDLPLVYAVRDGRWFCQDPSYGLYNGFSTAEEAKSALDRTLLAHGDYLIQPDEVERFEKKLSLLL